MHLGNFHANAFIPHAVQCQVKPMLDVYKLPEYVKYITKFVGSFACRIENDGFVLHYQ